MKVPGKIATIVGLVVFFAACKPMPTPSTETKNAVDLRGTKISLDKIVFRQGEKIYVTVYSTAPELSQISVDLTSGSSFTYSNSSNTAGRDSGVWENIVEVPKYFINSQGTMTLQFENRSEASTDFSIPVNFVSEAPDADSKVSFEIGDDLKAKNLPTITVVGAMQDNQAPVLEAVKMRKTSGESPERLYFEVSATVSDNIVAEGNIGDFYVDFFAG